MEKIFPTVLMILDFIAAIPYIYKSDLKMTVYWIFYEKLCNYIPQSKHQWHQLPK